MCDRKKRADTTGAGITNRYLLCQRAGICAGFLSAHTNKQNKNGVSKCSVTHIISSIANSTLHRRKEKKKPAAETFSASNFISLSRDTAAQFVLGKQSLPGGGGGFLVSNVWSVLLSAKVVWLQKENKTPASFVGAALLKAEIKPAQFSLWWWKPCCFTLLFLNHCFLCVRGQCGGLPPPLCHQRAAVWKPPTPRNT